MATTYTLINSNVLSSSAASVTFSSIPATYTDLVLRISSRNDWAATQTSLKLTINGSSSSVYSFTRLYGTGSAAGSSRSSGNTSSFIYYVNADTSTSNTFSSTEIYIPSYTASQNKPISVFSSQENNTTAAFLGVSANLFAGTTAISSLSLTENNGSNFMIGSSFYLYGISNA